MRGSRRLQVRSSKSGGLSHSPSVLGEKTAGRSGKDATPADFRRDPEILLQGKGRKLSLKGTNIPAQGGVPIRKDWDGTLGISHWIDVNPEAGVR